jgi:muramoyltetrapeptide carboxypeptidase
MFGLLPFMALANPFSNFNESMIMNTNSKNLPKSLKKGDTIGIIAPAGILTEKRVEQAIEEVERLGYRVKLGKNILKTYGYLAGTDQERLDDLHEMFADKSVSMIWCGRGGYGCTRLLDSIDYKLIKSNPKIFMGYSDITALHNAFYQCADLITFHGPIAASKHNAFSEKLIFDLIDRNSLDGAQILADLPNQEFPADHHHLEVLVSGVAEGIFVGGNLSLVAAMMGTKYEINLKDKILFLEDIDEEPYSIDRMLTQVIGSKHYKDLAGIMLGQFSACVAKNPENSLTTKEVISDRLAKSKFPVVAGLPFGHVPHNMTIPIGAKGVINTADLVLNLKSKVVF